MDSIKRTAQDATQKFTEAKDSAIHQAQMSAEEVGARQSSARASRPSAFCAAVVDCGPHLWSTPCSCGLLWSACGGHLWLSRWDSA
jgi:hypothetical protein